MHIPYAIEFIHCLISICKYLYLYITFVHSKDVEYVSVEMVYLCINNKMSFSDTKSDCIPTKNDFRFKIFLHIKGCSKTEHFPLT